MVPQAEGRDFSNVQINVRNVWYKVVDQVSLESISCDDDGSQNFGCVLEPTMANEIRGYSARAVSTNFPVYNVTLTYIDEQKASFLVERTKVNPVNDVRIIINGTALNGVQINGINRTLGDARWQYLTPSNVNRLEIQSASTFTVFLEQNNNTQFATKGRLLEGNFLNVLPLQAKQRIFGLLEHFNPSPNRVDKLIDLLQNEKLKLYEIALKIILDRFENLNEVQVKDYGRKIVQAYQEEFTIDDIIDAIENKVRQQFGSNGTGDSPDHGVEPIGQ